MKWNPESAVAQFHKSTLNVSQAPNTLQTPTKSFIPLTTKTIVTFKDARKDIIHESHIIFQYKHGHSFPLYPELRNQLLGKNWDRTTTRLRGNVVWVHSITDCVLSRRHQVDHGFRPLFVISKEGHRKPNHMARTYIHYNHVDLKRILAFYRSSNSQNIVYEYGML